MRTGLAIALALAALAPGRAVATSSTPLLDRVLELVRQNHDPAAVRAPDLVVAAFSAWARSDERLEVTAEPPGRPTSLELRTAGGVARLDLGPVRTVAQAASAIRLGVSRVEALGLGLGSSEIRLADGVLAGLDGHCALLPPGSVGEVAADVGVRLWLRGGRTTLREVVPGGPAARAGLRPGAAILSVDGERVAGVAPDRVADRLRGPAATTVRLEIEQDGVRRLALQRESSPVPPVTRARTGGVGYVRLSRFTQGSAREVTEAVAALQQEGPLAGLVLDLRGNPGGLVDEAVQLADAFLERGLLVETVGFGGRIREARWALPGSIKLPLVILVDGETASAAEILAGALSLHGRAVLAGDRTYGKGSVQVLYDLPGGHGLKLTVAEYRLEGGLSLQGKGLPPDAVLRALHVGDLEPAGFAPADAAGTPPPAGPAYLAREDPSRDPLVEVARRALAEGPPARKAVLGRLRAAAAETGRHEEKAVALALQAAYAVDWSPGRAPAKVAIETSASRLAGDRVELWIVVRNAGPAASRVRLWTRSPWLGLDRRELAIGKLGAGQTHRARLLFDAPAGARPARFPVAIHVDGEAGSFVTSSVVVDVPGAMSAGN